MIQPHLPIRLPCYDFTPVANPTFGSAPPKVKLLTSGITGSHGVTGGVYKARERIHRGMLIRKEGAAEGRIGDWGEVVTR